MIYDTSIDTSITKQGYLKIYQQQGAQLNDSNEGVDFIFGKNNKYHQIGNAYLELDMVFKGNGNDFNNLDRDEYIDEPIRLVKNCFCLRFQYCISRYNGW